jgi:hypothetical protein
MERLKLRVRPGNLIDPRPSMPTPILHQKVELIRPGLALELDLLQILEPLGQAIRQDGVAIGDVDRLPGLAIHFVPFLAHHGGRTSVPRVIQVAENYIDQIVLQALEG